MSRILLIKPPFASARRVRVVNSPPMGLLYLAARLRHDDPGRSIRLVDMVLERWPPKRIGQVAGDFRPDIVGISAMTVGARNALSVAAEVRRAAPRAVVVFGGPHATFMPERLLESGLADHVVTGEGEETFTRLVAALEAGRTPSRLPGTAVVRNGRQVLNRSRSPLPVDSIPWPAYDLLDVPRYHRSGLMPQVTTPRFDQYMTVMSSRACPYRCVFCHNLFGKRYRPRDPDDFVAEMEMLARDYRVREFHIIDDCFNLDRERTLLICERIAQRLPEVALAFPNGLRTDLLDREVLLALKRAGAYIFSAAIESGSPAMQKTIGKHLDLDRAARAIEMAAGLGLIVHGFFMIGFPGETEAQIGQTIDFARRSRLTTAGFFAVTVYPRTGLHEMARARGVELPDDFDRYSYHDLSVNLTEVPMDRLKALRREAYRTFYLDPGRAWNIWARTPRKRDIWRNLKLHLINFV